MPHQLEVNEVVTGVDVADTEAVKSMAECQVASHTLRHAHLVVHFQVARPR